LARLATRTNRLATIMQNLNTAVVAAASTGGLQSWIKDNIIPLLLLLIAVMLFVLVQRGDNADAMSRRWRYRRVGGARHRNVGQADELVAGCPSHGRGRRVDTDPASRALCRGRGGPAS
jgi:hypothetical protein